MRPSWWWIRYCDFRAWKYYLALCSLIGYFSLKRADTSLFPFADDSDQREVESDAAVTPEMRRSPARTAPSRHNICCSLYSDEGRGSLVSIRFVQVSTSAVPSDLGVNPKQNQRFRTHSLRRDSIWNSSLSQRFIARARATARRHPQAPIGSRSARPK